MSTIRYYLSDLEKMLEQSTENRKFSRSQILWWMLCVGDNLKSKHIVKIDSGAFLHQFAQVQVITDSVTGRKYIELPTRVYDMDGDRGINYISYDYTIDTCAPSFTSVKFDRTTAAASERLYYTLEETPSPDNPFFYRIGSNAWLLGIECIDVPYVEVCLYSTFDPTTVCNLDEEWDFPQELYPILQRYILDLARFGLQIPNNTKNMGIYSLEEQLSGVPKSKLVSVADTTADTTTTE